MTLEETIRRLVPETEEDITLEHILLAYKRMMKEKYDADITFDLHRYPMENEWMELWQMTKPLSEQSDQVQSLISKIFEV